MLLILPLIGLIVLLTLPTDILADAANTTNILVNVSEVSQISVTPAVMSWLQLAPGTNGTVKNITVENIGSTTYSTGIYLSVDSWANTTNNPTSPNTDASKYMSGSFLTVSNSTFSANDEYFFVNQVSWNETTYPSPSSPTAGADSWGYYSNLTNTWLWELSMSADGSCRNGTDTALKIQPTANLNSLSGATAAEFMDNGTQWSTWNVTGGPLGQYCIAVASDCKTIMIYKFDMNSSLPTCNLRNYIAPGSLAPSQSKSFDVKPHIPNGIPAGSLMNSTVTVTAVT